MKKNDSGRTDANRPTTSTFKSQGQDNEHDLVCKDCKTRCASFPERVSHSCPPLFKCNRCNETFKNDFRLNMHKKMVHNTKITKSRPFPNKPFPILSSYASKIPPNQNKNTKMSRPFPILSSYVAKIPPKHLCEVCDKPIEESLQFCFNCTEVINNQREHNLRQKLCPPESESLKNNESSSQPSSSRRSSSHSERSSETDVTIISANDPQTRKTNKTSLEKKTGNVTQRGRPRLKDKTKIISPTKGLKDEKSQSGTKESRIDKDNSTLKATRAQKTPSPFKDSKAKRGSSSSKYSDSEKDKSGFKAGKVPRLSKDSKDEKVQTESRAKKGLSSSKDARNKRNPSGSKDLGNIKGPSSSKDSKSEKDQDGLRAEKGSTLSKDSKGKKHLNRSRNSTTEKDRSGSRDSRTEKVPSSYSNSKGEKDRSGSRDSRTEKDITLSKDLKTEKNQSAFKVERDWSTSKDSKPESLKKVQDTNAGARLSKKRALDPDNKSPASTSGTNLYFEGRSRPSKKSKNEDPVSTSPKQKMVTLEALNRSLPDDCGMLLKPWDDDDASYKCPKCNGLYKNLQLGSTHYSLCPKNLECSRHRKTLVSPRDVKWLCSLCHLSFDLLPDLISHKISCTTSDDLKSSYRSTASGYDFESTRRTCPKCCYECVSLIKYQEHPCERILRGYQSLAISIEPISQMKEDYSGSYTYFECPCGKIFYTKQQFKRHQRQHPYARSKNCIRTVNIASKDGPVANPLLQIKKEVISRNDEEDSSDELNTSDDSENPSALQPDQSVSKKGKSDPSIIKKVATSMLNRSFSTTGLFADLPSYSNQPCSEPTAASQVGSVSTEPIDIADSRPQSTNSDDDIDFSVRDQVVCTCGGRMQNSQEEDVKPCLLCMSNCLIRPEPMNAPAELLKLLNEKQIKPEAPEVIQNPRLINDVTQGVNPIAADLACSNEGSFPDLARAKRNSLISDMNVGNLAELRLNTRNLPHLRRNAENVPNFRPNTGNLRSSSLNLENPQNAQQNDCGSTDIALHSMQDIEVQTQSQRYPTPPVTPELVNVQIPSNQRASASEFPKRQPNSNQLNNCNDAECCSGPSNAPLSKDANSLPCSSVSESTVVQKSHSAPGKATPSPSSPVTNTPLVQVSCSDPSNMPSSHRIDSLPSETETPVVQVSPTEPNNKPPSANASPTEPNNEPPSANASMLPNPCDVEVESVSTPDIRHSLAGEIPEDFPPDAYAIVRTYEDTEKVLKYVCFHCLREYQRDSLCAHLIKDCNKAPNEKIIAYYTEGVGELD